MCGPKQSLCISGLVVECIVAIDVTRVRFPADAIHLQTTRARGVLAKAAIPGQPQMETDRRPLEARATGRSAAGVMFSFADLSWDLASLEVLLHKAPSAETFWLFLKLFSVPEIQIWVCPCAGADPRCATTSDDHLPLASLVVASQLRECTEAAGAKVRQGRLVTRPTTHPPTNQRTHPPTHSRDPPNHPDPTRISGKARGACPARCIVIPRGHVGHRGGGHNPHCVLCASELESSKHTLSLFLPRRHAHTEVAPRSAAGLIMASGLFKFQTHVPVQLHRPDAARHSCDLARPSAMTASARSPADSPGMPLGVWWWPVTPVAHEAEGSSRAPYGD